METLKWGLNDAIPEGVTTAWGARLIFPDDLVPDRTDYRGPREKQLRAALALYASNQPWEEARRLADTGQMRPNDEREFVLFDDGRVRMVGSPRRSYGYLYVAA